MKNLTFPFQLLKFSNSSTKCFIHCET